MERDRVIPVPLSSVRKRKKNKSKKKSSRVMSLEEMEQGVVDVCSGRLIGRRSDVAVPVIKAHNMLQLYLNKLAVYYRKRKKFWKNVIEKSPGVLGCCSRAVAQSEVLDVSFEDYLSAQYWFFHEAFARPPMYSEIASPGALLRFKRWKDMQAQGMVSKVVIDKALGGSFSPQDTLPEALKSYEEKILENMIRQWGGEDKVWKLFGRIGNEEVFSDVFKKTRSVWVEMYLKS